MITAKGDRHGSGGKNLAYSLFGTNVVAAEIGHVGRHVADIDHLQGPSAVDRAADVEVIALQAAADAIGDRADGIGRLALIVGDRGGMVGAAKRDAENGDMRIERIEVSADG